jgi:hypothetical protein
MACSLQINLRRIVVEKEPDDELVAWQASVYVFMYVCIVCVCMCVCMCVHVLAYVCVCMRICEPDDELIAWQANPQNTQTESDYAAAPHSAITSTLQPAHTFASDA